MCESESEQEAACLRAYKIQVRQVQRAKYYKKNRDKECMKALDRAKRQTIAENSNLEATEARKKRQREAQARYYAKKQAAELSHRAAYALRLLEPFDSSDGGEADADNERGGTDGELENGNDSDKVKTH